MPRTYDIDKEIRDAKAYEKKYALGIFGWSSSGCAFHEVNITHIYIYNFDVWYIYNTHYIYKKVKPCYNPLDQPPRMFWYVLISQLSSFKHPSRLMMIWGFKAQTGATLPNTLGIIILDWIPSAQWKTALNQTSGGMSSPKHHCGHGRQRDLQRARQVWWFFKPRDSPDSRGVLKGGERL